MLAVLQRDKSFIKWDGGPINNSQVPPNCEQLWSDADLAKYGLYKVVNQPVPDGMIATSWTLTSRNGVPVNVPTTINAPVPAPTLEDRLKAVEQKLGM